MTEKFSDPGYGTYLVALSRHEDKKNGFFWIAGEIAMIFSNKRKHHDNEQTAQKFDLLFENGRTIFSLPGELISSCFTIVYQDPDTIIDGCSTNFGWQEARKRTLQL